jgi:proteasome alpha subunit
MIDEPYRWIEAVRNRREYLEDQLASGSALVALPYREGILMATFGSGSSKIFEVYDRIAFGGLGHPTDLEKIRTFVLEFAHLEGFNRSPADVNLQRLIKFGVAPLMKQAFEEILRAPFILRPLFAELTHSFSAPIFFTLDYDGLFEESNQFGVAAPSDRTGKRMEQFLRSGLASGPPDLQSALQLAMRAWALSLPGSAPDSEDQGLPGPERLDQLLRELSGLRKPEVALLDRALPGASKYRSLDENAIRDLTRGWLNP